MLSLIIVLVLFAVLIGVPVLHVSGWIFLLLLVLLVSGGAVRPLPPSANRWGWWF